MAATIRKDLSLHVTEMIYVHTIERDTIDASALFSGPNTTTYTPIEGVNERHTRILDSAEVLYTT